MSSPGIIGGCGARNVVFAAEDSIAVGIVPSSFLGVGEDLVGSLDFGEFSGGVLSVVEVTIWMELQGLLLVCPTNSSKRLD